VAEAGVEHSAESAVKPQLAVESGAESGALESSFDPAMQEAAHAWAALSDDAKRAMRAIVRVSDGQP
jgi:hypothetical protein